MVVNFVALAAGVAVHVGYFNRGEHHMYGMRYLALLFCSFFAAACALAGSAGVPFGEACGTLTILASLFLGGLYGSLGLYRIFLHPLKDFPGPFSVKVSSLCLSARLFNLNAHRVVLALHQKYGDFVRVGSSELSIAHSKAPDAIYGRKSKCAKADWYDLTLPMVSMQTTRSRAEHDRRRRVWGGAFSDKVLRAYEERVTTYQDILRQKLSASGTEPVNVTELYHQFSFDVMGDLSFGTSFGATGDWFAFKDYCCDLLEQRLATKVATTNITSFLIEPWKEKRPTGYDLNILQGDSQLIIVAGSDTTASTLTSMSYELAKQPGLISEIRNELRFVLESGKDISNETLQSLNLLNGVISETLRLHPPAGLSLPRKTPPDGLMIGDTYIPGNVTVWCPQYVVGRSEKAYKDALLFRPERWYAKPELIKEPTAYAPFSLGTYNCIGKPLALAILRTTVAKLILEFDISFAPHDDGTSCVNKTRTQFNTLPGPLQLTFCKIKP